MPDLVANYNEDDLVRFQAAAHLTDDEVTAYTAEMKTYLVKAYEKINMVMKVYTTVPLSKPYPDENMLLTIEADIAAGRWLEDKITSQQGERAPGGKGRHHVHQRGLDDLKDYILSNYSNAPTTAGGEGWFDEVTDDSPFDGSREEWS